MLDQRTAPYAALLLRLVLGTLFIVHIYWKFEVRGFDAWLKGLHDAGYGTAVVGYILCIEFAAAPLLLLGIATRWISLLAVPLMIGASQFWLQRTGFFFTVAGAEFTMFWGIALIVQALLGDGPYAVGWPWRKPAKAAA